MLQVPNGVGSALGATQLILYMIYRNSNKDTKPTETDNRDSMEMGTAKSPREATITHP